MVFSTVSPVSAFKRKLDAGELVVGTWLNLVRDPAIVRLLAGTGLDYLLVDTEHTGMSEANVTDICLLARECGLYPMVRPAQPENLKNIGRLLDAGAMGIVVPHIDSARQAREIAGAMRYFGGTRGYVSRSVSSGFEKIDRTLMERADAEVTCVVQFESVGAIEQADEILQVPGIDVAIVGRGDLAHEMGYSGNPTDPRVAEMVERVYAAARRNGKVSGLLVNDTKEVERWLRQGIGFLTMGSEAGMLIGAYKQALADIHTAKEEAAVQ